jgi:hypothetical protein
LYFHLDEPAPSAESKWNREFNLAFHNVSDDQTESGLRKVTCCHHRAYVMAFIMP